MQEGKEPHEVVEVLDEELVEGVDLARRDRDRQGLDGDVDILVHAEVLLDVDDGGDCKRIRWRKEARSCYGLEGISEQSPRTVDKPVAEDDAVLVDVGVERLHLGADLEALAERHLVD
jgi:hypothetical protein